MIKDIIQNVYSKRPLVHNITNYVAATDCANITLTIGASPIMADEPKEVGEVTQITDGLVLNCGTISDIPLTPIIALVLSESFFASSTVSQHIKTTFLMK